MAKKVGKTAKKAASKREKKFYSLLDDKGRDVGVFSGRSPRAAALKVARRGITDIRLREHKKLKTGEIRVFVYKGSRKKVKAPEKRPSWMGDTIWKGMVEKVRTEKIKTIKKKK